MHMDVGGNMSNYLKYELKEYTQKEYEADMTALLEEKGLHGAVEEFCDRINDEASALRYVGHRSVQEYLNDILFLVDKHLERIE